MANFSAPNQKPIKLGSVKYVKPKREISALAILCNFYTFRCTPVFSLSKKTLSSDLEWSPTELGRRRPNNFAVDLTPYQVTKSDQIWSFDKGVDWERRSFLPG